MYVITGASGKTGKSIALKLLASGKKVRVIGRDEKKLEELTSKGAEAAVGSLDDVPFMKKTFEGAKAAYALIPPNFTATNFRTYQNSIADAIAEAVKTSGVEHVVSLSSVGAHLNEGAGVVQGLHDMEQKLNKISGLNVLHLRPSYFMENLFGQIGMIRGMGIVGSAVRGDLSFAMIATQDIAEYAAKRLLSLNFWGINVQYLLGPSNVTLTEVTESLGKELGKPELKYVQFPYDQAKKGMMEMMGISENVAHLYNEFIEGMNKGSVFADMKRDAESTTPTSVEEFAKTFTYVYNLNK
jgi:uncharacterized protein YbjT (DUF2867 family)